MPAGFAPNSPPPVFVAPLPNPVDGCDGCVDGAELPNRPVPAGFAPNSPPPVFVAPLPKPVDGCEDCDAPKPPNENTGLLALAAGAVVFVALLAPKPPNDGVVLGAVLGAEPNRPPGLLALFAPNEKPVLDGALLPKAPPLLPVLGCVLPNEKPVLGCCAGCVLLPNEKPVLGGCVELPKPPKAGGFDALLPNEKPVLGACVEPPKRPPPPPADVFCAGWPNMDVDEPKALGLLAAPKRPPPPAPAPALFCAPNADVPSAGVCCGCPNRLPLGCDGCPNRPVDAGCCGCCVPNELLPKPNEGAAGAGAVDSGVGPAVPLLRPWL